MIAIIEFLIRTIVGIFEGLEPILTTVITTVVAIVLGRYLWLWRSKPVLVFRGTSMTLGVGDAYDSDEWDGPVRDYRVHLENWGVSAAENCKPEIVLQGQSETHRYELETSVCWSEGNNPARQTINRGENIGLIFFRWGKSGTDRLIRFPSENGWPDYTALSEVPLPSYQEQSKGVAASVTRKRTNTEVLSSVEWETASIKVTAENADSVEADVEFHWDHSEPRIKLKQTHGSGLHYWRIITHRIKNNLSHRSFYHVLID